MAFPIEIDAIQLTATYFNVPGVTPAQQPTQQENPLERTWPMEPGTYQFKLINDAIPAVTFEVRADGAVFYDDNVAGFLEGLGSTRLIVKGYPVTVDAKLLTLTQFNIPSVTPVPVSTQKDYTFQLLPGAYQIYVVGLAYGFTLSQNGTISYDAALDVSNGGCFAGREITARLELRGYLITIIAKELSSPNIIYVGLTPSWVSTQDPQTFRLFPGFYNLQPSGSYALVGYRVTLQGKINYDEALEGCFAGLGTTQLELLGYPIEITADQLSSPEIIYQNAQPTGGWRSTKDPQAFRLLPGWYNLQPSASYASVSYGVTREGKIDYDEELEGCFAGKESTQLELLGYLIEIIAEKLSTEQIAYPYIIAGLGSKSLQTFRLLPGQYNLQVAAGYAAVIYLVTPQGKIDYEDALDIKHGGCFSGKETTRLELLGYSVEIIADEKLSTPQITYPYIISGWVSGKTKQTFQLLPGSYNLQTPASYVSVVYTVTPQGKISYDEPLDASNGGCFAGKETTQLKLIGFSIAVDPSSLSQPQFLISEVTPSDEVAIQKKVTFHLLPGAYTIQSISGPGYIFSVTPKGTIDYDETLDVKNPGTPGFLSGRETATLTLAGYLVMLDATPLMKAISLFRLSNVTSWLATSELHTIRLLPANYSLDLVSGAIDGAQFAVAFGGLLQYDTRLEAQRDPGDPRPPGFLSGSGTATLILTGYPITLDATPLAGAISLFRLGSVTIWLATSELQTVHLLPANYSLDIVNGAIDGAQFEVAFGGLLQYDTRLDAQRDSSDPRPPGFLSGSGTARLTLAGYPVTLDATPLAATASLFRLGSVTAWLATSELHEVRLLPARYGLDLVSGAIADVLFEVPFGGTIHYDSKLDFTSGGFLQGNGETTLKIRGYSLLIDASEIQGVTAVLMPFTITIQSTSPAPQIIQMLPHKNLALVLHSTPQQSAIFDMEQNGTITFRKSYSFITLEQRDGHPLLRLTRNFFQPEHSNKQQMSLRLPLSIPLPNLDDRSFADLVEEGKRLIPGFAPSWTDHNPSDPGITFIELFAFIAEMLMYRVNRVTEANKHAFVRLLRGPKYSLEKSVDEEIRLAVLELRDEQRAITSEDFQRLAKEFLFGDTHLVVRAHCLPHRNLESGVEGAVNQDAPAHVSVLIVSNTSKPGQPPGEEAWLRSAVKKFLEPRCLLTTRLHVVSPVYLKVSVNVVVYVFTDQDEKKMEGQIKDDLTAYFHPLTGGSGKQGWPFGQAIYVADLYAVLDGIQGVDYITSNGTAPELVAEANQLSLRRILENGKLVGIRLEANELVNFDPIRSSITVIRQAGIISA